MRTELEGDETLKQVMPDFDRSPAANHAANADVPLVVTDGCDRTDTQAGAFGEIRGRRAGEHDDVIGRRSAVGSDDRPGLVLPVVELSKTVESSTRTPTASAAVCTWAAVSASSDGIT